jgi:myosin heavy subunit
MHQLRCNGVLEGIRICRRGYPNRIPFAEFLSRYRILSPNFDIANGNSFSTVQSFCHNLGLDPDRFQIGKSKVFCRVGFISELETMRRTKLAQILTGLQAQIRFYWTQIDMRRRKEEW